MLKDLLQELVDVTGKDDPDPDECEPPRVKNEAGECVCENPDGTIPESEEEALKEWDEKSKECICKPFDCPEDKVPDPETCKCVDKPEPDPDQKTKPGIAVLDDDEVSIFRIRWRDKDKIDAQVDIYKAAQEAPIIGRGTEPESDQVAKPSSEFRPFQADRKTFAQIKRAAKGKTGMEPFFAIDGSVIKDLANKSGKSDGAKLSRAGLGKTAAIRIVRNLFRNMLRNERKASEKMARYQLRRAKITDEEQVDKALAQLRAYGLVQPAAGAKKAKKRREKATGKVKRVAEGTRRRKPCKNCKKKKKLQESKKTDPWDSIRARMKELSGIK
jgi:hypothetical protein